MGRPSIFSREYETRMKRRKRTIFLLFLIIMISIGVFTFKGNLKSSIVKAKDRISTLFDKEEVKNNENQITTNKDINEESTIQEEIVEVDKEEEKFIDIKLSNGDVLKALYEGDGEGRRFKLISGLQGGNKADISPSGKSIILSDSFTQDLKLINSEGKEINISKLEYVSKNGEIFAKDSIISKYAGYNWGSSARFIDETHIVYLSQLPYFGTGDLDTYVWMIDTSNAQHKTIWKLKGKEISIGSLKEGKLEVSVDKKLYLLLPDGNVSSM